VTSEAPRPGQEDAYDKLVMVRQISDRAIVAMVAGGDGTNIVALKTAKGVVVVDTTVSPVLARPCAGGSTRCSVTRPSSP